MKYYKNNYVYEKIINEFLFSFMFVFCCSFGNVLRNLELIDIYSESMIIFIIFCAGNLLVADKIYLELNPITSINLLLIKNNNLGLIIACIICQFIGSFFAYSILLYCLNTYIQAEVINYSLIGFNKILDNTALSKIFFLEIAGSFIINLGYSLFRYSYIFKHNYYPFLIGLCNFLCIYFFKDISKGGFNILRYLPHMIINNYYNHFILYISSNIVGSIVGFNIGYLISMLINKKKTITNIKNELLFKEQKNIKKNINTEPSIKENNSEIKDNNEENNITNPEKVIEDMIDNDIITASKRYKTENLENINETLIKDFINNFSSRNLK